MRWSAEGVDRREAEAVLITGVFGSGKSSVAVEIADVLEKRNLPYAVLDLDFLAWFSTGRSEQGAEHRMMLENVVAVVGNFLAAGVRLFVLARSIRDRSELESLEAAIPMPLKVVRLSLPLEEIAKRLRSDVTTARQDDLREAPDWIAATEDEGIEDLTVSNDGPIRRVAVDIADWLGWK